MRLLTLIRHAKSSWSDPGLTDFDRPLNARGRLDAPRMGQRLAAIGFRPDLIVTSPAERALSTARVIATEIGHPPARIEQLQALYGASSRELLEVVRGLHPQLQHVVMVTHNPGVTDFCNWLCSGTIDNIPTCGIVRLELEVESWSNVEPGSAQQLDFDYPKNEPSE